MRPFRHFAAIKAKLALLEKTENRLSNFRIAIFVLFFVLTAALAIFRHPWANEVALAGVVFFFASVLWHNRLWVRSRKYRSYLSLLEEDKARHRRDWDNIPPLPPFSSKTHENDMPHFFADLDILGRFSVARLLNHTISCQGWSTFLSLFHNNDTATAEIIRRQEIVKDLKNKNVLRRRFYLAALTVSKKPLSLDWLAKLAGTPLHTAFAWPWVIALSALNLGALALLYGSLKYHWQAYFVFIWAIVLWLYAYSKRSFSDSYETALEIDASLNQLMKIVTVLESYTPPTSRLRDFFSPFQTELRPSLFLKRLRWPLNALSVRAHWLIHVALHLVIPWDHLWTIRVERIRKAFSPQVSHWITRLAEFEALLSLSEFAVLNPETIFPVLKEDDFPSITANQLGHPLLARSERVCNEIELNPQRACYLITGSNMSGKSTFLRTIGVNLCLAKAGGTVSADSFEFTNVNLHTSLRIADSLVDHTSTFYAEVKELKKILDAARTSPILYLIDEIFRGTNNRERLIGSRAYVDSLMHTRAIGALATHDLELTALNETYPQVLNYHFRETIKDEKMFFTYHLEPGPSPSTNALKIMQLNGLPV